jgi:hypothetical protein
MLRSLPCVCFSLHRGRDLYRVSTLHETRQRLSLLCSAPCGHTAEVVATVKANFPVVNKRSNFGLLHRDDIKMVVDPKKDGGRI